MIFILVLAIEWLPFWVSHAYFMQDVGLMEEGKLYVTAESALFNQENNSFLEARILLLMGQ